jgi:hypothetical protein
MKGVTLPVTIPRCDFCSKPEVWARYPAQSFTYWQLGDLALVSSEDWLACRWCADMISKEDWDGLLEYAVRSLLTRPSRYRTGLHSPRSGAAANAVSRPPEANAMIKPKHLRFIRDHAGQEITTESVAYSILPGAEPIIVAGDPGLAYVPGQFLGLCWLCKTTVAFAPKDRAILAQYPKGIVLCHSCYFQMDPEVVK